MLEKEIFRVEDELDETREEFYAIKNGKKI